MLNRAVPPGKQDHSLQTLTAETASSSPRETQLIIRATTPNNHTLWEARGGQENTSAALDHELLHQEVHFQKERFNTIRLIKLHGQTEQFLW